MALCRKSWTSCTTLEAKFILGHQKWTAYASTIGSTNTPHLKMVEKDATLPIFRRLLFGFMECTYHPTICGCTWCNQRLKAMLLATSWIYQPETSTATPKRLWDVALPNVLVSDPRYFAALQRKPKPKGSNIDYIIMYHLWKVYLFIPLILLMGKNPANLSLVVYPIMHKVLYIPGGAGFLPSTAFLDHIWRNILRFTWDMFASFTFCAAISFFFVHEDFPEVSSFNHLR